MSHVWLFALVGAIFVGARDARSEEPAIGLAFGQATVDSSMNALFDRKEGWIGADAAYSVDLNPQRRIWLFDDTWVGRVRDGKRTDATIVNNSIGLQDTGGGGSKIRFVVGAGTGKKPAAVIAPADGHGWFWLHDGVAANKQLFVFFMQIEKTAGGGAFGFRQIGESLGIIANPNDDPTAWRCEQLKLPCTIFSPKRQLTFGTAAARTKDHLYIYGTDEDINPSGHDRYLIVARVPLADIKDFSAWRFFDGSDWSADFRTSHRMVRGVASECSVSFLPDVKQYVLVYTDGGLSDRILARTAREPIGPWSAATTIYRCPEQGRDKKIFFYAAKAHPSIASGDELVVSYVANSFDFWQVASDASLYIPRFIRVSYRDASHP